MYSYMEPSKPRSLFACGNFTLISGQRNYVYRRMHTLIVEFALAGPVKVLIGGNRYDHYWVNYSLAAATPRYEQILEENIHLSRAETCYQMVELLNHTRTDRVPSLALDLLTTFYDESVSDREVHQLLFEAILELRRLSQQAAVVVSAHPGQNRTQLLKVLENAVERAEQLQASTLQLVHQQSLL